MSNCKHNGPTLSGRLSSGRDVKVCGNCSQVIDETPPELRAAIEALYANPPECIGAANVIRSIELAKMGLVGR